MKMIKVITVQGDEVYINPDDVSSVRRLEKRGAIGIDMKGNVSSAYSYLVRGSLDELLEAFGFQITETTTGVCPRAGLPDVDHYWCCGPGHEL